MSRKSARQTISSATKASPLPSALHTALPQRDSERNRHRVVAVGAIDNFGPADAGIGWTLKYVSTETQELVPNAHWNFLPSPFLQYVTSLEAGFLVTLGPSYLSDNPISFSCRAAATLVTATAPGYPPAGGTILSRLPSNVSGDGVPSQANLYSNAAGEVWLQLGRTQDPSVPRTPGIALDFGADANGTSGTVGAIQLVRLTRVATLLSGRTQTMTTAGRYVLDKSPSQTTAFYRDTRGAVGSTFQIDDSPAQQIVNPLDPPEDPIIQMAVDDSFLTYFIFQSNSEAGANAVPLFCVEWGWTATAKLVDDQWKLSASSVAPPTGFGTNEFPVWEGNIGQYAFGPPK